MAARKKCPRPSIVQTLVFPKSDFTWSEALDWIIGHRFLAGSAVETPCQYRARQWPARKFRKGSLRTIRFGRSSIQAVVGCPSPKTTEAYERRRARLKKPSARKTVKRKPKREGGAR